MQTRQSDIERQRQEQSDREPAERLRTAEFVVMGKVTAVRKSELAHMITHDPEWQEAEIEVAGVLRRGAGSRRRGAAAVGSPPPPPLSPLFRFPHAQLPPVQPRASSLPGRDLLARAGQSPRGDPHPPAERVSLCPSRVREYLSNGLSDVQLHPLPRPRLAILLGLAQSHLPDLYPRGPGWHLGTDMLDFHRDHRLRRRSLDLHGELQHAPF